MINAGLLSSSDKTMLLGPEKTKADVLKAVISKNAPEQIQKMAPGAAALELIRQGYDPNPIQDGDIVEFAVNKMQMLERRALTFRDVHPLALQTSPADGVARGVMVTRTVRDTAEVMKGVFLGTLKYEIIDDEWNWLLMEKLLTLPSALLPKIPFSRRHSGAKTGSECRTVTCPP